MQYPVNIGSAVVERDEIAAVMPAKGAADKLLVFLKSGQTITVPDAALTEKLIKTLF